MEGTERKRKRTAIEKRFFLRRAGKGVGSGHVQY